ncbi:hypothetical protein BJ165DRAFT_1483124 [Panaeolus papilionaceus]|nr:hypothetical protein BJ165DRAFT_1483124 [Panaeolus papilionaceus]
MRAQCYQKIEDARIPQQLFVMYHRRILDPEVHQSGRDLHPDAGTHESFDWHIKDCIQRSTGVDAWDFCSLKEHQFLLQGYWEPTWHAFMDVLDELLPASEKETLQIERLQRDALSEWKALVLAVALFSIKHLISMLENEAVSEHVKEKGGDNWRAITACVVLCDIGSFIWQHCPISTDIVSALDEISHKFFPPHVVSAMEDATFPFDFPHSESDFQKELLRSFSSPGPCALPRWFVTPRDFLDVNMYNPHLKRLNLGHLYDYIRLSTIWNGADPRLVHGFGRSWIYNLDMEHDGIPYDLKSYDLLGVGACELAEITTDPRTGLPLDWKRWSMWERWGNFKIDYEKAEEEHIKMKRQNSQPG